MPGIVILRPPCSDEPLQWLCILKLCRKIHVALPKHWRLQRSRAEGMTQPTMIDEQAFHAFGITQRRVAAIGQGSWKIEESAADSAIAAMRRGIDLGLTHIDTAEMYGSGAAETIIAKAI